MMRPVAETVMRPPADAVLQAVARRFRISAEDLRMLPNPLGGGGPLPDAVLVATLLLAQAGYDDREIGRLLGCTMAAIETRLVAIWPCWRMTALAPIIWDLAPRLGIEWLERPT